jgi:hypothetical protein
MELTPLQLNRLFTLLGALRDEILTPGEFDELSELLKRYPAARDYYLDYIYLCTDLCNLQAAIKHAPALSDSDDSCCIRGETADSAGPPLTLDILKELGDYENEAEALERPPMKIAEEPAEEEEPSPKPAPRVSKVSLFSLVTSLAALLLILVYPLLFPPPLTGVASVVDTIGASWSSRDPLEKGSRLAAEADAIQLIKGIVKIRTDKGAQLVLEAPAEFRFTNSDELSMPYGRIFVNVAGASNGFSVQTQNSKIIDLGTQFGVYTDMRGETELHVFEGKTVLIAGLRNKSKQVMDVTAGQARKFGDSSSDVRPIALSHSFFVRDIESGSNLVWRRDKQIDLADVVGGGDGLGTGKINTGLNPSNRMTDKPGETRDRRSPNTYNPVPQNPYIDGVFVPNGASRQIVSSEGNIFTDCPKTSGYFYAEILNTPVELLSSVSTASPLSTLPGCVDYSSGEHSFLCLHANSGITYDLNAFRQRLPGNRILRFSAVLGIPNCVPDEPLKTIAEFWILADGQVRYKTTLSRGAAEPAEVEIAETDRFLTLVVTDGGSQNTDFDRNAIGYDWCIFGGAKLILE